MSDWETVRVIFSQHKCRPTREGTDALPIAAQGAKLTSQIDATLPWLDARRTRSLRFMCGCMLAKHLENTMPDRYQEPDAASAFVLVSEFS
jgi:hypothetical protein